MDNNTNIQQQEPVYLTYGTNKIKQQDFLDRASNQLELYLSHQPWSNNRKNLFRKAYSDIMSKGVTGATNASGQWQVTYGGDKIDVDSLPRKEREMYGEAAYFIQQQMSGLTPVNTEEEKKKSDLPLFDNKYFTEQFNNYIGNNTFGGRDWTASEWNDFDIKDENGIRSTNERAKRLASALRGYSSSLKEGEHNFEGSPFTNLSDFQNKINTAITELENGTWNQADRDSLNAIGINPDLYLSTGEKDIVNYGGQEMTRGEAILARQKVLEEENVAKVKANAEQQKAKQQQIRNNQYNRYKFYDISKFNGKPLSQENSSLEYINSLAKKTNLNADELSELVGVFKLAKRNNALENLSKEELQKFGQKYINRPGRIKKINGVDGIYFDSVANRLIQPFNNNQSTNFQDILDQNIQNKLNEAEVNMNTAFKDIKEWTPQMSKELQALGWDVASILNPELFTGSAMALYASHLRDEANPNRGNFEKWLDRGLSTLGGIQGIGDLMMTGKVAVRLAKLLNGSVKIAGALGSVFALKGVPEAGESLIKLVSQGPSSMTPKDLENIAYGIMATMGIKSFLGARNRQRVNKAASDVKMSENYLKIQDKSGNTHDVVIDKETAKEINKQYRGNKSKEKADSEVFNHKKVKEAVKQYNDSNKQTKLELEGASVQGNNNRITRTLGKNVVRTRMVDNPNATYEMPSTSNFPIFGGVHKITQKAWSNQTSNNGILKSLKEFWSGNPKLKETNPSNQVTQSQIQQSQQPQQQIPQSQQGPLNSNEPTKIFNSPLTIESGRHLIKRHAQLETATDNLIQNLKKGNFRNLKPKGGESSVGKETVKLGIKNGRNGTRYKLNITDEKSLETAFPATMNLEQIKKNIADVFIRQQSNLDMSKLNYIRRLFGLKHGGTL